MLAVVHAISGRETDLPPFVLLTMIRLDVPLAFEEVPRARFDAGRLDDDFPASGEMEHRFVEVPVEPECRHRAEVCPGQIL